MKGRMTLVDGNGVVSHKTFDWTDVVDVRKPDGKPDKVLVQNISLYDHKLILDGADYRIAHMLSKES